MKPTSVTMRIIAVLIVMAAFPAMSFTGHTARAALTSGQFITKNVSVSNFTSLSINGGFEVTLTQKSGAPSIVLKGEQEAINRVNVNQTGSSVSISFRKDREYEPDDVEILITVPSLTDLSVGGGCDFTMGSYKHNDSFNLQISSGSEFECPGEMSVRSLNLSVTSGADAEIARLTSVKNINITSSSGADISVSTIRAQQTDISISSGADADIDTISSSDLSITASSGASVEVSKFSGNSLSVSTSSGADITVSGTTKVLTAKTSSSGSIDLGDLSADNANLSASSGGEISLGKYKKIEINSSSGGVIDLN